MKDRLGREIQVGDRVLKAWRWGSSLALEERTVTKVEEGRIYLDNSHVPCVRGDLIVVV